MRAKSEILTLIFIDNLGSRLSYDKGVNPYSLLPKLSMKIKVSISDFARIQLARRFSCVMDI